jgi:hypothetical protein
MNMRRVLCCIVGCGLLMASGFPVMAAEEPEPPEVAPAVDAVGAADEEAAPEPSPEESVESPEVPAEPAAPSAEPADPSAEPAASPAEPEANPLELRLRVGLSAAFTQSAGVVGQQDGIGVTFGTSVAGHIRWHRDAHDWLTGMNYAVAFAYTSVIGELVKTADRFQLESNYTWKGLSWVGPFVGLAMETPLFAGDDVRAEAVDYEITYLDGSVGRQEASKRLRLSAPFEPLQLKESVGVSFIPVTLPEFGMTFNAGLTAAQVFAEDVLSVSDKKDTAVIEASEIDSYIAVGQTSRLEIYGLLADEWVSYRAHGELFVPFVDSSPKTVDLSIEDRLNISVGTKLSFRIAAWASLDYELRALLQPQIQEQWQVQNLVMLTFGYDLLK